MKHNPAPPRVFTTLVGDIVNEPGAKTKYGYFVEALRRRITVSEVFDATLQGVDRVWNAISVFHPDPQKWRERFYKNVNAFRKRSKRVAQHLHNNRADLTLQIGVLFDGRWTPESSLPSIIYTDYTAVLSAQKQHAGRSPFGTQERLKWIELEKRAFQKAAHVFTRGKFVRDSIIDDYEIDPTHVSAIGAGANLPQLPGLVVRNSSDSPTALFIGKDFFRKGGDLLLRAFAQVRLKLPNARLLLLTAEKIPSSLPTQGIEIIQPTWDRGTIEDLYRTSDVFVLPSRLETWGDVLLEAMAFGLPCVGVSGEAMDEIIDNGKTGFVVPPEDTDALAAALSTLLDNTLLRTRFGYAGREKVQENYTWNRIVDRMIPAIEAATWQFSEVSPDGQSAQNTASQPAPTEELAASKF